MCVSVKACVFLCKCEYLVHFLFVQCFIDFVSTNQMFFRYGIACLSLPV